MRDVAESEAVEVLLRALYEGSASDGPWVRNWRVAGEMEELVYHKGLDTLIPHQYVLITLASDETRAVTRRTIQALRRAADRLLRLLDRYEEAAHGDHPEWAKLIALREAPFPVKLPPDCDPRDPDVVAVAVRDLVFDGSWDETLRWLSEPSAEGCRRIDRARVRRLQAFEETYEVDLADLLFSRTARGEPARLLEAVKMGGDIWVPPSWRGG
jgi:hypothetical protein